MPTVALMSGEGSPTALRHSARMKSVTSGGNVPRCAFTLFLRMRPESDRVAWSSLGIWVST